MRISPAIFLAFHSISLFGQTNLNTPFEECKVEGSITIYDYNANKWITNDIDDSHKPTLPASTFKIMNTLIALETRVVANEKEVVKWPGTTDTIKYGYRPEIYHDMTMEEAFETSAGWAYIELAKEINKGRYKSFLTESNYGNADVSIDDPDFWNFGNLKISPANQVALLIGVYEETLPFSDRSFEILKEIMIEEQAADFVLRAKTGWTRTDEKDIGWWIGYVEKEENIYFFATRLIKSRQSFNPNFGKCRKEITRTIFTQLNIL